MDLSIKEKWNNRIIYVVIHPYSLRDHLRFGGEYLMDHGYNVEIWRIVQDSSVYMNWGGGMYEGDNYHEYSLTDYKRNLCMRREDSVFVFQGKTHAMYIASGLKATCIVMDGLGAVPRFYDYGFSKENKAEKKGLFNRLRGKTPKDYLIFISYCTSTLIEEIRRKARGSTWRSNPPVLLVTSTHYASSLYFKPWEMETAHVLYVHAMDYDRYIEANQMESDESGVIVYIDAGFSSDTYDFVSKNSNEFVECDGGIPEKSALDHLFSILEEKYKSEVVVAGHPHREYSGDTFCGRRLVLNRTCELVKNSSLVVLTTSTAMNYIALYNKPVLKIASSQFKSFKYAGCDSAYDWIKFEAEEIMGCGFLNLDDKDTYDHIGNKIKQMDHKKREEYISKYIIDGDMTDKTIVEYLEDYISKRVIEQCV